MNIDDVERILLPDIRRHLEYINTLLDSMGMSIRKFEEAWGATPKTPLSPDRKSVNSFVEDIYDKMARLEEKANQVEQRLSYVRSRYVGSSNIDYDLLQETKMEEKQ